MLFVKLVLSHTLAPLLTTHILQHLLFSSSTEREIQTGHQDSLWVMVLRLGIQDNSYFIQVIRLT